MRQSFESYPKPTPQPCIHHFQASQTLVAWRYERSQAADYTTLFVVAFLTLPDFARAGHLDDLTDTGAIPFRWTAGSPRSTHADTLFFPLPEPNPPPQTAEDLALRLLPSPRADALTRGRTFTVRKELLSYGHTFTAGERLTLYARHYVPYDDREVLVFMTPEDFARVGHTNRIEEGMRLKELATQFPHQDGWENRLIADPPLASST